MLSAVKRYNVAYVLLYKFTIFYCRVDMIKHELKMCIISKIVGLVYCVEMKMTVMCTCGNNINRCKEYCDRNYLYLNDLQLENILIAALLHHCVSTRKCMISLSFKLRSAPVMETLSNTYTSLHPDVNKHSVNRIQKDLAKIYECVKLISDICIQENVCLCMVQKLVAIWFMYCFCIRIKVKSNHTGQTLMALTVTSLSV